MSKNEDTSVEDVIAVPDIAPELDADGNDITDWKARAAEFQGLASKNHGIATRFKTKLEKSKEAPGTVEKPAPKSGELDYGQKAFLVANGIKETAEVALVNKIMSETGKSLEDVIGSKYFQAEIKEIRDTAATAEATPKGTQRPAQTQKNTVDYWIAAGKLPPASEPKLRQDVVNARIKSEKGKSQFTSNPVVGQV